MDRDRNKLFWEIVSLGHGRPEMTLVSDPYVDRIKVVGTKAGAIALHTPLTMVFSRAIFLS